MSYWQQRINQLRNPAFRHYVQSCVIANLGSGMGYIAMTWQIVSLGGSVQAVAIMALAFWLPSLLFGPLLGVLADRFSRKKIMLTANLVRALALLVMAWIMHYKQSLLLVDVLAFSQGFFVALFWPAAVAFIREIVSTEELLYANATIDMSYEFGNIFGYGVAGGVIILLSMSGAYVVNALCFVLASIFLLQIKQTSFANKKSAKKLTKFWLDLRLGLRYISRQPALLLIYTVQLLLFIQYQTAPTLLAPFVKDILHAKVNTFGVIELSCSMGVLVGGLLLPWLAQKISLLRTSILAIILLALSYILFSLNHNLWLANGLYFLMGVGFAIWALLLTQAQKITALSYQGRTQATFNSLASTIVCGLFILIGIGSHWLKI
ncbi:MAG: MFS transporter, partial [Gammaproteobacteria bacterium]|nr:MFS transporter [Gammaproteobacteria bacterium]